MSFVGQGGVLKAAFGFSFAHRLVKNGAASGVFDTNGHEQLVVGTETGKICLQGSGQQNDEFHKIFCNIFRINFPRE